LIKKGIIGEWSPPVANFIDGSGAENLPGPAPLEDCCLFIVVLRQTQPQGIILKKHISRLKTCGYERVLVPVPVISDLLWTCPVQPARRSRHILYPPFLFVFLTFSFEIKQIMYIIFCENIFESISR
jgi:hypothetical protein